MNCVFAFLLFLFSLFCVVSRLSIHLVYICCCFIFIRHHFWYTNAFLTSLCYYWLDVVQEFIAFVMHISVSFNDILYHDDTIIIWLWISIFFFFCSFSSGLSVLSFRKNPFNLISSLIIIHVLRCSSACKWYTLYPGTAGRSSYDFVSNIRGVRGNMVHHML